MIQPVAPTLARPAPEPLPNRYVAAQDELTPRTFTIATGATEQAAPLESGPVPPAVAKPRRARTVLGTLVAGTALLAIGFLAGSRYGAARTVGPVAASAPKVVATVAPVPAREAAPEPSAPNATPSAPVAPVVAASAPAATQTASAPAATQTASAPAATQTASDTVPPSYVDGPSVLYLTRVALLRAQRCHPQGHAVGTADVLITFAPSGAVTDARLEGEPLASAPVARCILDQMRAIGARKFNGEPFTLRQTLTLR